MMTDDEHSNERLVRPVDAREEPRPGLVSRRDVLAGSTMLAGLLAYTSDPSEPASASAGLASAQTGSEPLIALGDKYEIDEDSNNDLIIRHVDNGEVLKYDASADKFSASKAFTALTADEASIVSMPASYYCYTDGPTIYGIPQDNPDDSVDLSKVTDTDIGNFLEEIIENQLPPQGDRTEARGKIWHKAGHYPGDLSTPTANGVILPASCYIEGEMVNHFRDVSGPDPYPETVPGPLFEFSTDGFITPNVNSDVATSCGLSFLQMRPRDGANVAMNGRTNSMYWDITSFNDIVVHPADPSHTYAAPWKFSTGNDRPIYVRRNHITGGWTGQAVLHDNHYIYNSYVVTGANGHIFVSGQGQVHDSVVRGPGGTNALLTVVNEGQVHHVYINKVGGTTDQNAGISIDDRGQANHIIAQDAQTENFLRTIQFEPTAKKGARVSDVYDAKTPSQASVYVRGTDVVVENVFCPNATSIAYGSPTRPRINGTVELSSAPTGSNYDVSDAGYEIIDTSTIPATKHVVLQDGSLQQISPKTETRSSDPGAGELGDGEALVYVSDGSAGVTGADGDVVLAVNNGGTVKTKTLADFSAL